MNTFPPRVDILPPAQRRLWNEFRTALPATFVLYGGTALALRTGSRQSEDFDFFTNEPIDAHTLPASLPFLTGAELLQAAPSTATFLLPQALGAAQALYPDFAPLVTLKALSYFGDGDLVQLPDTVKRMLSDAAKDVRAVDPVPLLSGTLT
jgi:hypothetical protein